jgi:glycosyltransferase involved in cell wall biosynthesis
MRVLWVTPELPYWPGGSGGSTRQYMLIRELVRHGHAVDVVAPVAPDQREAATALAEIGAELHATQRPDSRVHEVIRALRARPGVAADVLRLPVLAWQVEVFWTMLRTRMREVVGAAAPDVILVEHDWAARWRRELPAGIPAVLALENLSWRYYEQRAAADSGPRRLALRLEAQRFERFDRRALRSYDALLTMSGSDDQAVKEVSGVPSFVIANGVDTQALTAVPLPAGPVALFTGTFGYPPNAEALEWLLRDIWPRVIAQAHQARLLVVGRGVPEALRRLAGPSVEIAGFVPEMQPWFDRARAVLIPIRSGAGTRLKLLDGLASGRAIVSTTMGAEGVDVRAGEHLLVADDAQAFATATARVLREPGLAERLGPAARRLAETTYDWRMIGARLESVLERTVAAGQAQFGR